MSEGRGVDLSQPRYDQTTYWGRARHYFDTTNPLNLLVPTRRLEEYRLLLQQHQDGELQDVDMEELWRARTVCQSALHPDTGEVMFLPGRMAAQVSCDDDDDDDDNDDNDDDNDDDDDDDDNDNDDNDDDDDDNDDCVLGPV